MPSLVSEVRVTLLRPSEALLSWRPPSNPEEPVLKYEARYFAKVRDAVKHSPAYWLRTSHYGPKQPAAAIYSPGQSQSAESSLESGGSGAEFCWNSSATVKSAIAQIKLAGAIYAASAS